jgi:hypothetical protein
MAGISVDKYIALLYKKFMGTANSVPESKNYLSDISLFARPRIFANQQLFTNSVPDIPPSISTTEPFDHPGLRNRLLIWRNTNAVANEQLSFGSVYIGGTSLSDSDLAVLPEYPYLKKYVNIPLVEENPGISYTCISQPPEQINYLGDQIPYNYSTSLAYAPSVFINTYNPTTLQFDSVEANPTLGTYPYFLDQDAGVLTFIGTPINRATQYISMTYWRYEGAKGASSLSGVIDGGNAASHQ